MKIIRDIDFVGHKFGLNFNNHFDVYKTYTGGFVSLIICILTLSITIIQITVMVQRQQSTLSSEQIETDFQSLGEVRLSDMNILVFFLIRSTQIHNLLVNIPYNETQFASHLDWYSQNQEYLKGDLFFLPKINRKFDNYFRPCNQQDFEQVGALEIYNQYKEQGNYLVCQDQKNATVFKNSQGMNDIKGFAQNILTCNYDLKLKNSCQDPSLLEQYIQNFMIEIRVVHEQADFSKYNLKPTKVIDELLQYLQLDPQYSQVSFFNIRVNIIQTQDEYLQLYQKQNWTFFDIDTGGISNFQVRSVQPDPNKPNQKVLLSLNYFLSRNQIFFQRRTYGLQNMCADILGIFQLLKYISSILIAPILQHYFQLNAIQKLCTLSNTNSNFINVDQERRQCFKGNIKNDQIQFSFKQKLKLFIMDAFRPLINFKNKNKLYNIFKKGRKIVNKEMNIIKILRKLRFIKWFKVMNINSHQTQFIIKNSHNSLIDINNSDTSQSSSQQELNFLNKQFIDQQNYENGFKNYQIYLDDWKSKKIKKKYEDMKTLEQNQIEMKSLDEVANSQESAINDNTIENVNQTNQLAYHKQIQESILNKNLENQNVKSNQNYTRKKRIIDEIFLSDKRIEEQTIRKKQNQRYQINNQLNPIAQINNYE